MVVSVSCTTVYTIDDNNRELSTRLSINTSVGTDTYPSAGPVGPHKGWYLS